MTKETCRTGDLKSFYLFLTFVVRSNLVQVLFEGRILNVQHQIVGVKINFVLWACDLKRNDRHMRKALHHLVKLSTYSTSDALCSTDLSKLKVAGIVCDSFSEFLGSFCFTLSLYDLLLTFLTSALDEESSSLSLLWRNLFVFHSSRVFLSETEFSQRNVIEDYVEISCTIDELTTNEKRNLKSPEIELKACSWNHITSPADVE